MPKWLQKTLVVLISVLTFGLVTPPQTLLIDKVDRNNSLGHDPLAEFSAEAAPESSFESLHNDSILESEENLQSKKQKWIQLRVKDAKEQSFTKFGQKIKPKIEEEFREVILPNIELVIGSIAEKYPEEELKYLAIAEGPSKGKSERIFHITNQKTGLDVIRFHVRRDQPPQQGHWFNFHYHTYHDQYQAHHDLGSIYWAKNTPPNWMS